jgi:hypothetical protein
LLRRFPELQVTTKGQPTVATSSAASCETAFHLTLGKFHLERKDSGGIVYLSFLLGQVVVIGLLIVAIVVDGVVFVRVETFLSSVADDVHRFIRKLNGSRRFDSDASGRILLNGRHGRFWLQRQQKSINVRRDAGLRCRCIAG